MTAHRSDTQLIEAVRSGEQTALTELYQRYSDDALRVARVISIGDDADELVAEAFVRLVDRLRASDKPVANVRAYLHTIIRNLNTDQARRHQRERPASDMPWLLDGIDDDAASYDSIDGDRAATALRSLPQNWQQLLWELDVQGRKPADVAGEQASTPEKISSTAYRARLGLRAAYLETHVPPATQSACQWSRERLSQFVRGSLSSRATDRIENHLETCAACALVLDDLESVNRRLAVVFWPILVAAAIAAANTESQDSPARDNDVDPPRHRPRQRGRRSHNRGHSRGPRRSLRPRARTKIFIATAAASVAVATMALGLENTPDPGDSAAPPGSNSTADPRPDGPESRPGIDREIKRSGPGFTLSAQWLPADEEGDILPPVQPAADVADTPADEPAADPAPEPVDLQLGTPTFASEPGVLMWLLTVPITAVEGAAAEAFTINLTVNVDTLSGFIQRTAADWYCGPIEDGDSNGDPYFFQTVTCQYAYAPGQPITPFTLVIESFGPAGNVSISGDGNADPDTSNDQQAF